MCEVLPDESGLGAFDIDDDAQDMEQIRQQKQQQREQRIVLGSDSSVEKVGELSSEEIERIAKLTAPERELRWGFTHDELKAATKVVSVLFASPHLFVGDPVLAESRLYTMVSRCRTTKRGNRDVMKKMLAQEQARKKKERKAQDLAALQKTKMKQERDAALNALLLPLPPPRSSSVMEENDDGNASLSESSGSRVAASPTVPLKIILTQFRCDKDQQQQMMHDGDDQRSDDDDDEVDEVDDEDEELRTKSSNNNNVNSNTNNDDDDDQSHNNNKKSKCNAKSSSANAANAVKLNKAMSCQICHTRYDQLHHYYYALCPPCAELNFTKRNQKRDLRGRTVLLTGCRIKIGYEMALSLLRCGATLIATTRFVHDALNRFMHEKDYAEWKDQLHLFALDMRDLWMVEQFCAFIKNKFKALFAIINNAAQTIARTLEYTDSLRFFESQPIPEVRQSLMARQDTVEWMSFFAENCSLRIGHPLQLEHRPISSDSSDSIPLLGEGKNQRTDENSDRSTQQSKNTTTSSQILTPLATTSTSKNNNNENNNNLSTTGKTCNRPVYDRYDTAAEASDHRTKNSWTTKLAEVEGSEAAEVMAINALAPLIINARLRTMLEAADDEHGFPAPFPLGKDDPNEKRFIINVSAMEGQFYRFKQTTHPHTNMAKAALNMMTRTSGADYAESGIFINSCDTGWCTDETVDGKRQKQWTGELPLLPIDEADGAARCLDLIYTNSSAHSKFWKDYKEIPW